MTPLRYWRVCMWCGWLHVSDSLEALATVCLVCGRQLIEPPPPSDLAGSEGGKTPPQLPLIY